MSLALLVAFLVAIILYYSRKEENKYEKDVKNSDIYSFRENWIKKFS